MNFALLGDDPLGLLIKQAALDAGHGCRTADEQNWMTLLTASDLAGVIVAGDSEQVQAAAKQLASAGKPLLIVPKVAFGTACAYELSLIRDDSAVVLMPAFLHRVDLELRSLVQRLRSGELGTVRRLEIDVTLPAAENSGPTDSLSEVDIEEDALPDIDLLRWLGGNYDQVTALRSGQTEQGCSQATLTLAGTGLPDVTWVVRRGADPSWRLSVSTERGVVTIERPPNQPHSHPARMLSAFAVACGGTKPEPDWPDAVRAFDVLDAARRSLRRRRTIDLHFETLSERQQFKTQMTAIGCGLLMLTLVLMLGLLGLGALLESRDRSVKEANAAGLLLLDSDFEQGSATLTADARQRLERMTQRLKEEPKSLYVEPTENPAVPELDRERRAAAAKLLADHGLVAADHRTLLAPAKSDGWNLLLRILRIAWVAPLVVFLGLQFLLFIARPASSKSD